MFRVYNFRRILYVFHSYEVEFYRLRLILENTREQFSSKSKNSIFEPTRQSRFTGNFAFLAEVLFPVDGRMFWNRGDINT